MPGVKVLMTPFSWDVYVVMGFISNIELIGFLYGKFVLRNDNASNGSVSVCYKRRSSD